MLAAAFAASCMSEGTDVLEPTTEARRVTRCFIRFTIWTLGLIERSGGMARPLGLSRTVTSSTVHATTHTTACMRI